MAQMPRTPVHFPRMKVRGWRNKAKLAARHTYRTVIPYARPTPIADGVTFVAITGPEPGAVRLEFTRTVDGFGRRVTDSTHRRLTHRGPHPHDQT